MTIAAMMVLTIVVSGGHRPADPAIPVPLPVRLRRTSDVSLRNILFGRCKSPKQAWNFSRLGAWSMASF